MYTLIIVAFVIFVLFRLSSNVLRTSRLLWLEILRLILLNVTLLWQFGSVVVSSVLFFYKLELLLSSLFVEKRGPDIYV